MQVHKRGGMSRKEIIIDTNQKWLVKGVMLKMMAKESFPTPMKIWNEYLFFIISMH